MSKTAWSPMGEKLKAVLPGAVWSYIRRVGSAVLTPFRFSFGMGHFRSCLAARAIDRDGKPLPWYTYPAIDAVQYKNFSGRKVLEFGGGQSTRWWSARADRVVTIEPNETWANELKSAVGANVDVHHVPIDRETRDVSKVRAAIESSGVDHFDVIVVDGHLRREAALMTVSMLTDDGVMIFDNAQSNKFHEVTAETGHTRIDFHGWWPGVHTRGCTSFAFKGDCFLFRPEDPVIDVEATRPA
ncbi:MAG: hypothetical protein AAGD13_07170 [Pseudomonadota bacterium]